MIKEAAHPRIQEPIGILGYGVEGESTCRYLLGRGFADLTVFDRKRPENLDSRLRYAGTGEGDSDKSDGARIDAGSGVAVGGPSGTDYLALLPRMRTVFRSAGVRADHPRIREFLAGGGILTSQTGLAIELAGRHRIIGVTGTLGKGTCCSLLEAMLRAAGIPVRLGGNIGVPALDLAAGLAPEEKLILELSSFQLSTLAVSPAYVAVLRTTSEHLDWHADQNEYWLHKSHLVAGQTAGDFLVYCADAPGSAWIAAQSPARKRAYGHSGSPGVDAAATAGSLENAVASIGRLETMGAVASTDAVATTDGPCGAGTDAVATAGNGITDDGITLAGKEARFAKEGFTVPLSATRLTGAFNLENVAAAGALALALGAQPEHVLAAAGAFAGLEHRLEFVRRIGPVDFFNDSYATRPEATLGALSALSERPLGLILGGSEKFADFSELARAAAVATHLRAIALIGQTAPRLQSDLNQAREALPADSRSAAPEIRLCDSLETALRFLRSTVTDGAIALSPACASFGMFANYKERGKAFKKLVMGLEDGA